jgi:hypothetical protein
MTGAGLGDRLLEGAALFRQTSPPVACYDGTMLLDEINRQCTRAQLPVKPMSTGKWLKERHLDGDRALKSQAVEILKRPL